MYLLVQLDFINRQYFFLICRDLYWKIYWDHLKCPTVTFIKRGQKFHLEMKILFYMNSQHCPQLISVLLFAWKYDVCMNKQQNWLGKLLWLGCPTITFYNCTYSQDKNYNFGLESIRDLILLSIPKFFLYGESFGTIPRHPRLT